MNGALRAYSDLQVEAPASRSSTPAAGRHHQFAAGAESCRSVWPRSGDRFLKLRAHLADPLQLQAQAPRASAKPKAEVQVQG